LCILHKIRKCGKEIGEIINKIGEKRNFHIVSIDTVTAFSFELFLKKGC